VLQFCFIVELLVILVVFNQVGFINMW